MMQDMELETLLSAQCSFPCHVLYHLGCEADAKGNNVGRFPMVGQAGE